jgi:DNA replication and repair protein RecF
MLNRLEIRHFRNHESFLADIPPNGCIFSGPNGSGKTSILEAIFLLASLKSFRLKNTYSCIQNGEPLCEVKATCPHEELVFRCQEKPKKKTALFWNNALVSASEMLEKKSFFAVLFCPEDLLLPFASPENRRRYLNRVLIPIFSDHFVAIRKYEKILRSRNALLKRIGEGVAKKEELDFYNKELAAQSHLITTKRREFFTEIEASVCHFYATISGASDPLRLVFEPNVPDGDPLEALKTHQKRDILRGTTSCGAHLDDFSFFIRKKPLIENASRGEVRSTLLALKMSEKLFIKSNTKKHPSYYSMMFFRN